MGMFYSFGYDPQLEDSLRFVLTDIVLSNPSTVTPLSFVVSTWEPEDGQSYLVDQQMLELASYIAPGALQNLEILFGAATESSSFPVTATVSFLASHSISRNSAVRVKLPSDFGLEAI